MIRRALVPLPLLFTLLLLLAGGRTAHAVDLTGQLRGSVTDPEGLAVPGVLITLRAPQMQGTRQATSAGDGSFRFTALPVGDYTLIATANGFQTVNLDLRVASGLTVTADVRMVPVSGGGEIVVTDTAPVVDVTTTRTGLVMTRDTLRDLPNLGRDYQGVMELAPGVTGSGNPNMRGGLSFGNQYFVDGVNTTDPVTGTFSVNMNFDAIEEVQVITGGMDAEYGRSMGGAVNVVTRSGGNEIESDVQLLYSGSATQVYTPLPSEEGQPEPENAQQFVAGNIGGPILKDTLWYFAGFQYTRNLFTPALTADQAATRPVNPETGKEFPVATRDWQSAYLFGKLTWRPSEDHRLWLQGQTDPTRINNSDASPYVLPNAETFWRQGGWLGSVGHQWTPGDAFVMDNQLSVVRSYIKTMPMAWKDCGSFNDAGLCTERNTDPLGAWLPNDPDGYAYGPTPIATRDARTRATLNSSGTFYFDALGGHQLKVGLQADLLTTRSLYAGYGANGLPYYNHDGDPSNLEGYTPALLLKYDDDIEVPLGGTLTSLYVQDVWSPLSWLTVRPGLRMDHSRFSNVDGEVVFNKLTLAPRLGAAADLTNDGRTRAHVYYGRFYDSGFLEIGSLLSRGQGGGYYNWDEAAGTWASEPFFSFADSLLMHDDLRVPRSDEWDIGLARDFGGGWGVSATFTAENTKNLWEDDEVNLIWDSTGGTVIGSRDGTGETRYRLRTPDEAFIQYRSLELLASRQFDENWGMIASYTYSRAFGRFRDDQAQGLASSAFDIAPQQVYEVGLMPYDTPHVLKVNGSWRDASLVTLKESSALGLLTGWNLNLASGTPYRPSYFSPTFQDWSLARGEVDGSYRLPMYAQLDLKLGFTLAAGRTTWDLTAECFNVLNSRTVVDVGTAVDDPDTGGILTNDAGAPFFGTPLAFQAPRIFQLGLRGEF